MAPRDRPSVLVLGIGNLLWADEGFGVRAVEAMHRNWQLPDNVHLMDGGTQGIYLLQHVRDADILIVFDAVDYDLEPGTLKRVAGEDVPKFLGVKKVSLHQTGFQEVLAMAEMLGDLPEQLLLIGVQPEELEDFGGSLRPIVADKIEPAIAMALDYLATFGIKGQRLSEALSEDHTIASLELTRSRYEGARPSSQDAYRHGDLRVLEGDGWQGPENFEAEIDALLVRRPEGA